MSFFMNVKHRGKLDSVYNFETFGKSMILLFQMSTSAGWNEILDGLINEKDCKDNNEETGVPGDCGNTAMGIAFLLTYLVISFLIIINMYIAVILENYSQATEDVQEGLTDDDYDMYYEIWQQFDPEGTQYVKFSQLSDFLDVLEPPLQIHKPNKYKIISMDIPICTGDLCYCVDVLDALTKDFFARKGNPVEETAELGEVTAHTDRPGYEPISSTLWRQREDYCARLIQSAWRNRGMFSKKLDDVEEEDEDDIDDSEDDIEEGEENYETNMLNVNTTMPSSTSVQVHPYSANEQSMPSPTPADSSSQQIPENSVSPIHHSLSPTIPFLSSPTKDSV